MNRQEKDEIQGLPDKYKPVGAWGYFGYQILFALPIIGFICLIIFALSSGNINRRSFARSYFVAFIIVAVITIILIVVAAPMIAEILEQIKSQMPTQ